MCPLRKNEPEPSAESHAASVRARLVERIVAWQVAVDYATETETAVLAFGRRDDLPVVLKVVKAPQQEWRTGEILGAFRGNGVVRVYDHADGAMLLERLIPGEPLVRLCLDGRDEEATAVLARTIEAMAAERAPSGVPGGREWRRAFERHAVTGDDTIPAHLVSDAHDCTSI